ncbi:DUF2812 domain-containing protein [Metabacillus sp. GX 13764]|uniref:DUF2812 domain-containing protein n=1 Tax=Metabacillus kandeliae TaxID=2900151 RepID=UPI001E5BE907|nr:DUF2812 domain-containing protein [Metabacillus kandeliae]MCD7036545.1 DUF2812 domain-containing protein [Metabacillus kandeliae]
MKQMKRVFKLIPAWKDDQEEEWLAEMSRSGWHFKKYSFPFFTFEKGAPKEYVYRLDFQNSINFNREEYLSIFEDAGWESAGEWAGWQYFRTESSHASPEIFTDPVSKSQKYSRLLTMLLLVLSSIVVIGAVIVFPSPKPYMFAFKIVYACLIFLYVFLISRMYWKIRQLR